MVQASCVKSMPALETISECFSLHGPGGNGLRSAWKNQSVPQLFAIESLRNRHVIGFCYDPNPIVQAVVKWFSGSVNVQAERTKIVRMLQSEGELINV